VVAVGGSVKNESPGGGAESGNRSFLPPTALTGYLLPVAS
jgi:hypothetical protein